MTGHPDPSPLTGFDRAVQRSVPAAIDLLGLAVPTAAMSGATAGCLAIDHIAVPRAARVDVSDPVAVARQLSDHWAYVVDVEVRPARP